MKFPESWLRTWVDPDLDTGELAERLTMAGHEVDAIEVQGESLQGVVVAEVIEVARHPDADKLSVCRVTDGKAGTANVVCGAPNVVAGMKAAFAPPGTTLPGGLTLVQRKIRGVESQGMLCSAAELGLGQDADGILRLPDNAPLGTRLDEYLELPDRILDLDLTPNRGDCFSMLGMARDIAAISGTVVEAPEAPGVAPASDETYPVELVDADACPRFAARVVRGIDPAARSPLWLTERLRRSGVRAISPVVDVTNYVMLELGQPLHAYDLDRLRGVIRPRMARAGERLTLLDGREIELSDDTVVVSDDSGPIGLAGIMGGLGTAVSDATRNVFFEAAFWPTAVIAGRARAYSLHTDASLRFERGVDPGGQARAVERATELLLEIAGGTAGRLVDEVHPDRLPQRSAITLRRSRLQAVLGAPVEDDEVLRTLRSLGIEADEVADGWQAVPPGFRFDLSIEDDLIEEIARIYGYDRIPESTATADLQPAFVTERQIASDRIADTLVARDYQEVVTYSFIDAETDRRFSGRESSLVLSNPISSEMSVMRASLWPGMLKVAASNVARQQDRVRLFEIGASFHGALDDIVEVARVAGLALGTVMPEQWGSSARGLDFFDIKGDVEALLHLSDVGTAFSFAQIDHPALQPGQSAQIIRDNFVVGTVGKLHPEHARSLDITRPVYLFELDMAAAFAAPLPAATAVSKYPAIRRDIAIVVPEDVPSADLVRVAMAAAPAIIRRAMVFDVYRGPEIEAGLKSIALGLILQETSRTLTDEDADSATASAVRKLQQEFAAALRE